MATPHELLTVEPVGRRQDRRVRVLLGPDLLCETSRDVISAAGIDTDQPCDRSEFLDAVTDAEPEVAKERALRLLGHRERTRHELTQRLTAEGLSLDAVAGALDRLEEIGALSDERFAEWHIRCKAASGWGRPRIERTLKDKGVSGDISAGLLEEFVPLDDERERALQQARARDLDTPKARERALARLARRGFSPSDAIGAIRQAESDTR